VLAAHCLCSRPSRTGTAGGPTSESSATSASRAWPTQPCAATPFSTRSPTRPATTASTAGPARLEVGTGGRFRTSWPRYLRPTPPADRLPFGRFAARLIRRPGPDGGARPFLSVVNPAEERGADASLSSRYVRRARPGRPAVVGTTNPRLGQCAGPVPVHHKCRSRTGPQCRRISAFADCAVGPAEGGGQAMVWPHDRAASSERHVVVHVGYVRGS
jgi:hypothetical protein